MKPFYTLIFTLLVLNTQASPVQFQTPDLDRWMYPFNATPGTRSSGLVFGAQGNPGFDERDAQFLVGYNTTTHITGGLAAEKYLIHSATLTLRHNGGDFVYDPTSDSYTTYLDPSAPAAQPDSDPGRPVELFGAGYRNGYTYDTFSENTAFGPGGPPASGTRNSYALGYRNGSAVDVSNSIDALNDGADGFNPTPFALGQIMDLNAGDTVRAGDDIIFHLNLSDTNIRQYLQQSLSDGWVGLMATSFHSASRGGSPAYPSFETKENLVGQAGILDVDVTVIPEPSTLFLWVGGCAILFHFWRKKGKIC